MIEELVTNFDLVKIKNEVFSLLDKHGNPSQLCLQGKTSNFNDWQLGTGPAKEDENLFKHIHESIIDFELAKIITHFNAVRSRIMVMNRRSCYSIHRDFSKRIHIPIKTDDQSWMIWPYENFCTQLKEGKVYLTDTTKMHTFVNGSLMSRVHLILCVYI